MTVGARATGTAGYRGVVEHIPNALTALQSGALVRQVGWPGPLLSEFVPESPLTAILIYHISELEYEIPRE